MRLTAGNDAPFRWAVTLQGKPFDLSGKDVKVYVINSRGEIPVARLTIEGHEVSGVFEGRYQTRLGEHSLVLRVNEGRPEMKTATVANVFELVQWSAEAGGSDEGNVIVAPVLIESELSIGGSSYDDTEVKTELARLEREKADKQELTELSAEVSELSEGIALRNVGAEDTDESVEEPSIPIPAPSASNEWKCVADRRILEGEKNIIFTTYADGTPLKATELMVQLLNDKKPAQNITGYVGIKSTNNQNEVIFGPLTYENSNLPEGEQRLQQLRICASPFFTSAELRADIRCVTANVTTVQTQGGNLKTFQIYEDIVYVKIAANAVLTSAAPYLKIYAR